MFMRITPEESRSRHYDHLAKHGGMVSCGEGLGVFVGIGEENCPPGWVYVDLTVATPDLIRDAFVCANSGREEWPEKQDN